MVNLKVIFQQTLDNWGAGLEDNGLYTYSEGKCKRRLYTIRGQWYVWRKQVFINFFFRAHNFLETSAHDEKPLVMIIESWSVLYEAHEYPNSWQFAYRYMPENELD